MNNGTRLRRWWLGLAVLALVFSPWLVAWAHFGWTDELASYVLLIPVISAYLIWQRRSEPMTESSGSTLLAIVPAVLALIFAGIAFGISGRGGGATHHDYLTAAVIAFLLAGLAWAILTLGVGPVTQHRFAIAFLLFAAPLPSWAVNGLEIFYQHTSAEVAAWLMQLCGLPMLRAGLFFQLPGITIQVAQECSGIRSSLVLFIVSILGGYMLLAHPGKRLALALFVIPLGIVRNAFRILTIAWLCVHYGARMIDSPIHHRGGPIFFGLSLIPLFLFLLWLRRKERAKPAGNSRTTSGEQSLAKASEL